MKKKVIIILTIISVIIISIIITGIIVFSGFENNLNELKTIKINYIDLTEISDGTYKGSYSVFPVSAEVDVTVKDHKITRIDLLIHNNGQGQAAESIPGEVVRKGSLDVDIVSGATYSSKVILKAIENALNNAVH